MGTHGTGSYKRIGVSNHGGPPETLFQERQGAIEIWKAGKPGGMHLWTESGTKDLTKDLISHVTTATTKDDGTGGTDEGTKEQMPSEPDRS